MNSNSREAAAIAGRAFGYSPQARLEMWALTLPQVAATLAAIETMVGRVWCQILRVKQIDRHDNFFELGGHSLLGMQAL